MQTRAWRLVSLQLLMIASLTESGDNYQTTNLNLHQGVIVRDMGNVMLGHHSLDIYLPIELQDYRAVLKRYFVFLKEAPTRLLLQIIALKVMTYEEIETQKFQNATQNITDSTQSKAANILYPIRNIHPLLKALYWNNKLSTEKATAEIRERWEQASTQRKKEWTSKIECLSNKDLWLTNNWKPLEDSNEISRNEDLKIPRCFHGKKSDNSSIVTSNEATLEDISVTLLKKLGHIEAHYANLNKIYGPKQTKRRRRGLVNIIGDVQKYLWGTATTEDVQRVEHLVLKMKTGNTKVLHALGSLEVVVQKELDKTNFLLNQAKLLNSQISHLTLDIIKVMRGVRLMQNQLKVERVLQTFTQILQQTALGLGVLERDISQFLNDLDKASSNLLSSTLITPDELRQITDSVCESLPYGKSCNFGPEDATYFQLYQEITTEVIKLPQGVKCVKLQLAINDESATMKLLQINKIPIPIEGKGKQYIQPRINEEVLYGTQGGLGVEIKKEDLQNCRPFYNTPKQCEETKYKLLSEETLNCIRHIESRESQCPTEIVNIVDPALFVPIGTGVGLYNFKKKKSVTLICDETDGRRKSYIPLHGYGKLMYRSDCDLTVNGILYVGTHNLNSTHHFAIKQAPFEDINIPYRKLPQLGLWSKVNDETWYSNIDDLLKVKQAAEKAAKEIDEHELEFEPIQQMLTNTEALIKKAEENQESYLWYETFNYTDWGLISVVAIMTATALFLIVRRCRNQKESELNRVVKSFRKTLQDRLKDNKKNYDLPQEQNDSEEEAETLELKPMKVDEV